jgi:Recombination endonuclease VII
MALDLTGEVFGRLTVVGLVTGSPSGRIWEVRCACGNTREIRTGKLRSGEHVSCGCLRLERMRAHAAAQRIPVIAGKRRCSKCKKDVSVEDFHKATRQASGLQGRCKRCARDYELRKKYGITIDEYEALLATQGGHCAVCPATEGLDVDHSHETGKVRGILCGPHNRALGLLGESPLVLLKLVDYVRKF